MQPVLTTQLTRSQAFPSGEAAKKLSTEDKHKFLLTAQEQGFIQSFKVGPDGLYTITKITPAEVRDNGQCVMCANDVVERACHVLGPLQYKRTYLTLKAIPTGAKRQVQLTSVEEYTFKYNASNYMVKFTG